MPLSLAIATPVEVADCRIPPRGVGVALCQCVSPYLLFSTMCGHEPEASITQTCPMPKSPRPHSAASAGALSRQRFTRALANRSPEPNTHKQLTNRYWHSSRAGKRGEFSPSQHQARGRHGRHGLWLRHRTRVSPLPLSRC